ncbi:long-chain acyl-CoA synthetase [Draconibacterium orientale]|uniref:Long-chain acyl-CoA synthetase n=1 Tax=Draconibacterium orientale TaxID=1168034 RepID=X5DD98_9BACT|nr:AMP-binding protein [Draconibacterium orientale]AHW60808.1 long-chain fatty acid--CoA ligase [Draconibacterium orientale]SES68841.1 long-chain acyl-CoA synthetase [Draconibacterium orientale]
MKTIVALFETAVANYPDNPYLWEKSKGEYRPTTYKQTREKVLDLAAGLIQLGFKKGDRAALIADGRNDWIISELGMLYAGGINVPLSIRLQNNELTFRLKHSGSRYIFVSKLHAAKVEEIRDELPEVEKVIYIDGKENPGENDIDYKELVAAGAKFRKENTELTEQVWKGIQPDDVANISYTSGTTADPKGIMLTHLNYAANVVQSNSLLDMQSEWITLAILPWDHAFAHTTCLYVFMYKGASIASVEIGNSPMETLRNIPKNIQEIKPTLMMSVPAYSKTFRKNIEAGIRKKGEFLYKVFQFALKVAYAHNGYGNNRGKGWRFFLKPLYWLFDEILFAKVREGFGGNLKFFIGGGALLDVELQRFFYAVGLPICQGYGLTEAAPVISSNVPHDVVFGSSGKLVKNLEIKILDDNGNELPTGEKGEIVIKGDNVMKGYWNNPTATADSLKDGWLHTGDMGYMGKDDFLYVLGRFKSLLIGNDGEKYSPEGIEEALVDQSPYIQQVMLYNNQNPYTVGMVVPDMEAINRELKRHGIAKGSDEAVTAAIEIIQKEINEYKKGGKYHGEFPERWLPATVAILPEAFTTENKMLNATMKMVRDKVTAYFAKELEFLYTAQAKNIVNEMNIEAMKKWMK